ncbi:MAG: transposase [Planctomycetaceae bacterium]|nr:transposase [Planctomycetaceae bacterium]
MFRNRQATAIKILIHDGRGFWLCHSRAVGLFQLSKIEVGARWWLANFLL